MKRSSRDNWPVPPISEEADADTRFLFARQSIVQEASANGTVDARGSAGAEPAPSAQVDPYDDYQEDRPHEEGRSVEYWLGRNAIGVVASVLVFIGLVLLGATIVPQFTDEIKVGFMFALSSAFTIAGTALSVHRKNGFTTALMGCGTGSLFISIFATHLYFGMIGEIAAFALVLLWMVLCLALIRKTQSLTLAIVLQLGLATSVCLGYCGGVSAGRLPLLIGYQAAASIIVIGGNLMFYRKMLLPSLMTALALSLVASVFMWREFSGGTLNYAPFDWPGSDQVWWMALSSILQAVAGSALFVLIVKDVIERGSQVEESSDITDIADSDSPDSGTDFQETFEYGNDDARFRRHGESQPVALACAAALWLAIVRLDVYYLSVRLIWTTLCQGTTRDLGIHYATIAGTAIMLVIVAFASYGIVLFARRCKAPVREGFLTAALMVLLVGGACAASLPALVSLMQRGALALGWMWVWALFAIGMNRLVPGNAYRNAAIAFVAIDVAFYCLIGFRCFEHRLGQAEAALLGAAYLVGLTALGGWLVKASKPSSAGIVLFAAFCTAFFMSYIWHCTLLASAGYQWSIWCMVCALACIAAGFRFDVGGLRLYGLILALGCVLKLVALDAAELDSTARIVAFIIGGIICFAISALYNSAVRHRKQQ